MEIRNVLERLKLLTNDDREDLLLMLSGDAVQRLKARLCCTVEEENAHEEALCAAAAAQAAYQFGAAFIVAGQLGQQSFQRHPLLKAFQLGRQIAADAQQQPGRAQVFGHQGEIVKQQGFTGAG